ERSPSPACAAEGEGRGEGGGASAMEAPPHPNPLPRSTEGEGTELRLSMHRFLQWIDRRAQMLVISCSILLTMMIVGLLIAGPRLGLESDATVMHPRPNPPLEAQ